MHIYLRTTVTFQAYSNRARFQAARFNPIGEADSELAFCVLLDQMAAIWTVPNATPTLRQRFLIVSSFAGELTNAGTSKFLVFRWRYACRSRTPAEACRKPARLEAPGLMLLQRQCQSGRTRHRGGWALNSKRRSACHPIRERSPDKRAMGASCRRGVSCCFSWAIRCTTTGRREPRILTSIRLIGWCG